MQFSRFHQLPALPVSPCRARVSRIIAVRNIAGSPSDIANGVQHTILPNVSKLPKLYAPEFSNGHSNGMCWDR